MYPGATELLRYGMRVAVLGVPGAEALKMPEALSLVGLRAFDYDVDFAPLAQLLQHEVRCSRVASSVTCQTNHNQYRSSA